jgi:hypothetical protein
MGFYALFDDGQRGTRCLSKEPEADVARLMTGCGKEVRAMRHDLAGAVIVIMLRSLKMPGMAQAVGLLEQGPPALYRNRSIVTAVTEP